VEKPSNHSSHVDAMGQEKRRQVVGHSYGPSRRSQMIFFALVAVVVVVILGGWTLAVAAFDTAPESYPDKAPWSTAAQQNPTRSPSGPCGEPGNPYPPPADSPCAAQTSPKTSVSEPTAPGGASGSQEEGSGGAVGGNSESQVAPN
jgi:cytoskeletal protein RodZ